MNQGCLASHRSNDLFGGDPIAIEVQDNVRPFFCKSQANGAPDSTGAACD
jgi:hypothetical protein